MTRFELVPKYLEELLQAATLPRDFVVEVSAAGVWVFGWFPVLDFMDFRVDFLDAACEGARAEESVYHATLESVRVD